MYTLDIDSQQVLTQYFIKNTGEFQPLGVYLRLRDANIELLPKLREHKAQVPGRHGEVFFDSEYDVRMMDLPVHLAADMATAETQKRRIAAYLHKLTGTYPLAFEWAADHIYNVRLAGGINLKQWPDWLEFAVQFKMPNPFAYHPIEKKLIGAGNIVNLGDIEAPLRIEIPGDVTNPQATIGGVTYLYTGTVDAGSTLIVDTDTQTVKIGSVNVIANWGGGFPEVESGTSAVTVTTGTWNLFWTPRYLV